MPPSFPNVLAVTMCATSSSANAWCASWRWSLRRGLSISRTTASRDDYKRAAHARDDSGARECEDAQTVSEPGERIVPAYQLYVDAASKFDYFVTGGAGAVLAYSLERFAPNALPIAAARTSRLGSL